FPPSSAAHPVLHPFPTRRSSDLIAVSDYKGISYAERFPDREVVLSSVSPFGDLAIYSSSYLHFAPGLSDNAAFNLTAFPRNAYLDRKSTRLNSSHVKISYAVFCL